jgi:hypothetical protein
LSRLKLVLPRLAIAVCALITAAVVAAGGAPANALAASTARPPMTHAHGFGAFPQTTSTDIYLCLAPGGPVFVIGNPATGCVLSPGRQYSCTPALLAMFFGF